MLVVVALEVEETHKHLVVLEVAEMAQQTLQQEPQVLLIQAEAEAEAELLATVVLVALA